MEYKLPEGFNDRNEAIESLLKDEAGNAHSDLMSVKHIVESFLIEAKGYSDSELETDREFDVTVDGETAKSKVDIVISIDCMRLVSIICSADAVVSRERHALACARLLESYQIPFTVITDGMDAIVLDTVSGNVIGESPAAIPSKEQLVVLMAQTEFRELPVNRVEREKRIVRAFDAIG
ncbi:MAG: hypothetical protein C4560_03545 [Nitrospiraceae bacterium]|nr:MAG: hypothetical protein C4560_03545 [Nitrospiraceae bacterium]